MTVRPYPRGWKTQLPALIAATPGKHSAPMHHRAIAARIGRGVTHTHRLLATARYMGMVRFVAEDGVAGWRMQ